MKTQKNYKDTVYRMLFGQAKEALSLYNSLNGTSYTDASVLEFNTLENAIYMGMKNDLSFLVMEQMHLYEQQASYTPNMPLRDLFYVADLLQALVKDKSLYSSKQIKLPTPHFVVFYNGLQKLPERQVLKLSDAFEIQTDCPELELKVLVLNINPGMNEQLKDRCPTLKEYVIYVERVRSYVKNMPLEEAVEKAIDDCIQENILRDFLTKQRAEVFKMSIYEYDEERERKLMLADERELGKAEGMEQGRAEEKKNTETAIKVIISMSKKLENSKEETITLLMKQCNMSQERAESAVNKCWD